MAKINKFKKKKEYLGVKQGGMIDRWKQDQDECSHRETQTQSAGRGVFMEACKSFKACFNNGPLRKLCCFSLISLYCLLAV